MNAALFLVTTAWMAGADTAPNPAPMNPAPVVSSVHAAPIGSCAGGGCASGGCGGCSACESSCDDGLMSRLRGHMSSLKARFSSSSCGCKTCADPCESSTFGSKLRDRLHGMFHRDSCDTGCSSCGGCATGASPSGACGGVISAPLPGTPVKPEKPKEDPAKQLPEGGKTPGTGTKPGEVSKPILQPATLELTPAPGRSPY